MDHRWILGKWHDGDALCRDLLWCLTADGWHQVPDPVRPSGDYDRDLAAVGFMLFTQLGSEFASLGVSIYCRGDMFLVCLTTPNAYRPFVVDGLPQLLTLLPRLTQTAATAATLDREVEAVEAMR